MGVQQLVAKNFQDQMIEEFARSMIFLGCNSPLLISSFFSQARESLSFKSRSVRLPQGTSKGF